MTESQIILYTTPDGDIKVDTVLRNETIWIPQTAMAELFGVNVPAISKHLSNIYEEGELSREATISKMETVQNEGGRRGLLGEQIVNGGMRAGSLFLTWVSCKNRHPGLCRGDGFFLSVTDGGLGCGWAMLQIFAYPYPGLAVQHRRSLLLSHGTADRNLPEARGNVENKSAPFF